MSTFKITSTAGHPERVEDFNGTTDEFILYKFGSRMGMEDQGCKIEEVEAPAVVEEAPKPKRKKAVDE
jgi:hypothetical protein